MLFFLATTVIASFAGLVIPRMIHLGKGVSFEMATSDIQATKMNSILDTVKELIPSNPVAAFAEGNMLQVLMFALIVGFTLIAIGEKGEPLLKVIDSCNAVSYTHLDVYKRQMSKYSMLTRDMFLKKLQHL